MTVKKGRGRPTKDVELANRKERAELKLLEEVMKSDEMLADNYHKYMEILHKVAMDELGTKEVSITNQVSTLKFLLQQADAILKREAAKAPEEGEGVKDKAENINKGNEQPKQTASLISLDFQKQA